MSVPAQLVLAIDTCGPYGSVALGQLAGSGVEILGQTDLEGRTYSATLVAAIRALLAQHQFALRDLHCLAVVSGPGSFTGVRVGLSAAKGLAEGAGLPVVAVSRLEVLAYASGCTSAALDAHRHEIFLRIEGRELLAAAADLASIAPPPRIAVCDAPAAALLEAAWPTSKLVHAAAPTAADALRLAISRIEAGDYEDIAALDGHYLRRSDAEIFGNPAHTLPA
jgi:tRNA threonylcarbamoyladenosine biosynthesis protein TsaB